MVGGPRVRCEVLGRARIAQETAPPVAGLRCLSQAGWEGWTFTIYVRNCLDNICI